MRMRKLTPIKVAGPIGAGLNARRGVAFDLTGPSLGGRVDAGAIGLHASPSVTPANPPPLSGREPDPDRLTRADRQSLLGGGPEVLGAARHAYLLAGLTAVLWAGVLVAFEAGYENRFSGLEYRPFAYGVFGALVLLPVAFLMLGAFNWRQAAKLAAETRRARALAGELLAPAALAALQTGGAVQSVREEIDRAAAAALQARDQLSTLRESLAGETERLAAAAVQAGRTAQGLTASLAHERGAMGEMSVALDGQTQAIAEAITRQAKTVGDASDLARAQVREAEAGLAASSADLAGAASRAAEAAAIAGQSLSGETERLERAGVFLGERYRGLESVLSDQHAALESLACSLSADQAELDARLAQRRADIQAAAAEGGAALAHLGEAARTARAEHAELEARARDGLGALTTAAAEQRALVEADAREAMAGLAQAAEQARLAAAGHAEAAERNAAERAAAARAQIEELNEAAFAAGRQADQTFEARLAAARRLVEQSAAVVDEAGARSAARIEAGLAASKDALAGLQTLLAELDGRIGRLPVEVQAHADALRTSVTQGVDELTAAARRAADETRAIDAAFQSRVRRNYEMLSEAVQLMGKVAGEGRAAAEPRPAPQPRTEVSPPPLRPVAPITPAEPTVSAVAITRAGPVERTTRPAPIYSDSPSPALRPTALSEPARVATPATSPSLRPRLSPSSSDDGALEALFEPEPAAPSAEAWTWRDLLSSIEETPIDDETLADRLLAEIEGMGVDTAALLPTGLTDEIARGVQAGDGEAVAAAVKRAAPAAVRRLSRRLSTDKVLRAHAERFLQRYEALMADAVRRDPDGFIVAALLGSDAGRAGLLLDVARREPA